MSDKDRKVEILVNQEELNEAFDALENMDCMQDDQEKMDIVWEFLHKNIPSQHTNNQTQKEKNDKNRPNHSIPQD